MEGTTKNEFLLILGRKLVLYVQMGPRGPTSQELAFWEKIIFAENVESLTDVRVNLTKFRFRFFTPKWCFHKTKCAQTGQKFPHVSRDTTRS